jgi:two-component system, cell cycle response regulator DivK
MTKRILVVEDTEDNRQILRDLLRYAGFALIEAVDGESGVTMARLHRPDLVLMDLQLPVLDGFEATRQIRTDPTLRHMPIIAVTSYAWSGDAERAIEVGCNAYVAKPFSPRALLAKIRDFWSESERLSFPRKRESSKAASAAG